MPLLSRLEVNKYTSIILVETIKKKKKLSKKVDVSILPNQLCLLSLWFESQVFARELITHK